MREEDESNWFARWEDELPRPEELMPLSQTLISSDLALAFDLPSPIPIPIPNPNPNPNPNPTPTPTSPDSPPCDDSARTLKRPRLVWTPQLHKRFVDSVAHLGIKNAVPKTIMQLMSVDGLTRENVASHLQKYRLYLKRMQGLSSSAAADAAADHLFAANPVPHPIIGRGPVDSFVQFMPPPMIPHHQMLAMAAAQQYYHQRQFGSQHRMVRPSAVGGGSNSCDDDDDDDVDSREGGRRRILTLFPTCGDD